MQNPLTVCGRPYEDFLSTIQRFHGWIAPGVVIGGLMVDLAQEHIGPDVEADAIIETTRCLPDAIQLFTPCTYGNGWMKVVDWDKFALTLYNKKTLEGIRIWLDIEKSRRFPDVYNWYMRLASKEALPLDILLKSIEEAGGMCSPLLPCGSSSTMGNRRRERSRSAPNAARPIPPARAIGVSPAKGRAITN